MVERDKTTHRSPLTPLRSLFPDTRPDWGPIVTSIKQRRPETGAAASRHLTDKVARVGERIRARNEPRRATWGVVMY